MRRRARDLLKLPDDIRKCFEGLVIDIRNGGPVRGDWPNYSKLADGSHHCHLSFRFVAVWCVVGERKVEVTYVGSRKKAPY
jgi:hypothetical protein